MNQIALGLVFEVSELKADQENLGCVVYSSTGIHRFSVAWEQHKIFGAFYAQLLALCGEYWEAVLDKGENSND